ncbi:hypothetical protein GW721_24300 [Citrobacter braakii]|nr:hypothetical protein [Citrobacter braakii]
MKQFKNAVAVAIAAAGLYSVSAMAGTAVHWADSDAGSAKDVKWQVVQPSTLDFIFTTADVQSVNSRGEVNEPETESSHTGGAGTWLNVGDAIYVDGHHTNITHELSQADGDNVGEFMLWGCTVSGNPDFVLDLRGSKPWPPLSEGFVYGTIYADDGGLPKPVPDITKVKSTKFTDNITVTKYAV